jgi:hypothetical protein
MVRLVTNFYEACSLVLYSFHPTNGHGRITVTESRINMGILAFTQHLTIA